MFPMTVPPLPPVMIEPLVRAALLEDLGRAGDITSDAIVPAEAVARVALVARQAGVVAGLDLARLPSGWSIRALGSRSAAGRQPPRPPAT